MKTIEDYLNWLSEIRKELRTERTQEMVRQACEREPAFYSATAEMPLYPTDDNQCILTDLNGIRSIKLIETLGFRIIEGSEISYSPWNNQQEKHIRYTMDHPKHFIATACHDPANIYFGSLEKATVETVIGFRVPVPEVKLLGANPSPEDFEKPIIRLPMSTWITLHPSQVGEEQYHEQIVIDLLKLFTRYGKNTFYGGFKTQEGVLHQNP